MAKLFGLNKPNTNLRKNVFDLSEQTLFTTSAGMLMPCMVREMNPGEKAQVSMTAFTRTFPLNTAAYVRMRQYFHFFFVPYKQLWNGWDNFINGVDYKTSSLQRGKTYNAVPKLDLFNVIAELVNDGYIYDKEAHQRRGGYTGTHTRPNYRDPREVTEGSARTDIPMDFDSSPTTDVTNSGRDEFGFEVYHGISRLLDMLGYGFTIKGENISSLSDYLKMKLQGAGSTSSSAFRKVIDDLKKSNFAVNPFRLLAYQKIYSDFYKRDDYEATDPLAFNADDVSESFDYSSSNKNLSRKRFVNMLRMRYRWLPKDYFTGIVPSELFGTTDVLRSLSEGTAGSKYSDFLGNTLEQFKGIGMNADKSSVSVGSDSNLSGVTTKSIRAAFAIEKLHRLTRRASGFDYISQTAAHYGFDVPEGRGDKVQFIGGFSNPINITEVVSTASTEKASTGQVSGRGVGVSDNNRDFDYTAKEHGILMCITSILPESSYSAEGMNRFNTKFERGDYFHPEFQDLGLQPVFGYELKNRVNLDSAQSGKTDRNKVLGYVPMYSEYKTAYDTLHGEFRNGKSLGSWSSSNMVTYNDVSSSSGALVSSLLCNPSALDRIFAINFNGDAITDQFMVSAQFVCKMIRPMSITGQQL